MCAAPAAAPTIPISEIGESITRCLAELVEQAFGDLERAAVCADVLAEAEDVRVALHLLEQRFANRLEIGDLGHQCSFSGVRSNTCPTLPARSCLSTTLRRCPRGTRAASRPADRRRRRSSASSASGSPDRSATSVASSTSRRTRSSTASISAAREIEFVAQARDVARDRIVLALPALDLARRARTTDCRARRVPFGDTS